MDSRCYHGACFQVLIGSLLARLSGVVGPAPGGFYPCVLCNPQSLSVEAAEPDIHRGV